MDVSYSISVVAQLANVSIETLRAWERRYNLIAPRRDRTGVRRYSQADVERVRLANTAKRLGYAIGTIASYSDDELRALVRAPVRSGDSDGHATAPVVAKILKAIRSYDVARAEELLAEAAMLQRPEELVLMVLSPLMQHVGRLWERGRLSIAQEHLIATLVRNLIGILLRSPRQTIKKAMLFATPPGDAHEFGIELSAFLASMCGIKACVLGPEVPVDEVSRAARYIEPDAVIIGTVLPTPNIDDYVSRLRKRLDSAVPLFVGGHGSSGIKTWPPGTRYVASLRDFCELLRLYSD